MKKLTRAAGAEGKSKVQVKTVGVPVALPLLVDSEAVGQVLGDDVCFDAGFSAPTKNTSTQFKSKSN